MKARYSLQLGSIYFSSEMERYRIVSGVLPFASSSRIPSTKMSFPVIALTFAICESSGIRYLRVISTDSEFDSPRLHQVSRLFYLFAGALQFRADPGPCFFDGAGGLLVV